MDEEREREREREKKKKEKEREDVIQVSRMYRGIQKGKEAGIEEV